MYRYISRYEPCTAKGFFLQHLKAVKTLQLSSVTFIAAVILLLNSVPARQSDVGHRQVEVYGVDIDLESSTLPPTSPLLRNLEYSRLTIPLVYWPAGMLAGGAHQGGIDPPPVGSTCGAAYWLPGSQAPPPPHTDPSWVRRTPGYRCPAPPVPLHTEWINIPNPELRTFELTMSTGKNKAGINATETQ